MSPEEICRGLGEAKVKTIFAELTADGMKKVLREAKIPTTRMPSHTSTKKRNEDWARRLWGMLNDKPIPTAAATLIFEWLTRSRRPMLGDFLSGIGVAHDNGLTDADFMKESTPEKMAEVGKALLAKHDRAEVAAYLLFLDATNQSEHFKDLGLEGHLKAASAAA